MVKHEEASPQHVDRSGGRVPRDYVVIPRDNHFGDALREPTRQHSFRFGNVVLHFCWYSAVQSYSLLRTLYEDIQRAHTTTDSSLDLIIGVTNVVPKSAA